MICMRVSNIMRSSSQIRIYVGVPILENPVWRYCGARRSLLCYRRASSSARARFCSRNHSWPLLTRWLQSNASCSETVGTPKDHINKKFQVLRGEMDSKNPGFWDPYAYLLFGAPRHRYPMFSVVESCQARPATATPHWSRRVWASWPDPISKARCRYAIASAPPSVRKVRGHLQEETHLLQAPPNHLCLVMIT